MIWRAAAILPATSSTRAAAIQPTRRHSKERSVQQRQGTAGRALVQPSCACRTGRVLGVGGDDALEQQARLLDVAV